MRSKWLWAALAVVAVLGITTTASATTRGLITGNIFGSQVKNHTIAEEKLTPQAGGPFTLTVSIVGSGGGWVTSYPAGISCGSTCSAQFPAGTLVSMGETPAIGSTFAEWSGGPGQCPTWVALPLTGLVLECWIYVSDNSGHASVQATFNQTGPPCTAPNVKGRTLADAKARIRRHNCNLGIVEHAFSRKVRKGRVISQIPPAGWQEQRGSLDLVLSKGRR